MAKRKDSSYGIEPAKLQSDYKHVATYIKDRDKDFTEEEKIETIILDEGVTIVREKKWKPKVRAQDLEVSRDPKSLDIQIKLKKPPPEPDPRTKLDVKKIRKYEEDVTLVAHTQAVYCVDISPDMKHIVSCGHDGQLISWWFENHEIHQNLRGHSGWVLQCKFSPCGGYILSCSADLTVRIWGVKAGNNEHTFLGHQEMVTGCAYSNDGKKVVSCSKDRTIMIWDVTKALNNKFRGQRTSACEIYRINGHPINPDGHAGLVMRAVFTNDCKLIISCAHDNLVKIWNNDISDGPLGQIKRIVADSNDHILHVALNKEGDKFLTTANDRFVRVYNTKAARFLHLLQGHEGIVYCAEFSPERNGRRIISCGGDAQIIIWDTLSGLLLFRIPNAHKSWILGISIAIDGRCFATASGDNNLKLWWPQLPPQPSILNYFTDWTPSQEEAFYQFKRRAQCNIL